MVTVFRLLDNDCGTTLTVRPVRHLRLEPVCYLQLLQRYRDQASCSYLDWSHSTVKLDLF